MNIPYRPAGLLCAALVLLTLAAAACDGGAADRTGSPQGTSTQSSSPQGGSSQSAGSAQDSTALCPLTAADVSTAIGVTMRRSSSARCGFVADPPTAGRVIEVYYTPIDAMVYDGSEGEAVSGVGDGARWDTQMSGSLLVKNGSRHFSVQAVAMGELPDKLRPKNLAIAVAKLVLAKAG